MDKLNDVKLTSKSEPDSIGMSSSNRLDTNSPPIKANTSENHQIISSDPIIPTLKGKVELLNRVNIDLLNNNTNINTFSKHSSPFEKLDTESPSSYQTVRPRSPLELLNSDPPTKLQTSNDINKQDFKRVKKDSDNLPTLPSMSIVSERRISLPSYDSNSPFERKQITSHNNRISTNINTHHHHELKSNVNLNDEFNSFNNNRLPYQMPQLQDNSSLIVVDSQAQPISLVNMMEIDPIKYPQSQQSLTHTYNHRSLLPDYSLKINSIVKVRIARSYLKWGWFHDRVRDHELWGSMIYTDDSDLVAVLIHLGFLKLPPPPRYNPNTPNKPCIPGIPIGFNLINDWIVEIRILPKLPNYSGTDLKGYRSRSWGGDHDGVSYQVLNVYLSNGNSGGANDGDSSRLP